MDSLFFNAASISQASTRFSNDDSLKLENAEFSNLNNNQEERYQMIFQKRDGDARVIIKRNPDGKVKEFIQKIDNASYDVPVKEVSSFFKLEDCEETKAVFRNSQSLFTDHSTEVTPSLKVGMDNVDGSSVLNSLNKILFDLKVNSYQGEPLRSLLEDLFEVSYQMQERGYCINAAKGYSAILKFAVNLPNRLLIYQFKKQALLELINLHNSSVLYNPSYINYYQNALRLLDRTHRVIIEDIKNNLYDTKFLISTTATQGNSNLIEKFRRVLNLSAALEEWAIANVANAGYHFVYKYQAIHQNSLSDSQRAEIYNNSLKGLIRTEFIQGKVEIYKNLLQESLQLQARKG